MQLPRYYCIFPKELLKQSYISFDDKTQSQGNIVSGAIDAPISEVRVFAMLVLSTVGN
jgi:hypothetical protein